MVNSMNSNFFEEIRIPELPKTTHNQDHLSQGEIRLGTIIRVTNEAIFIDAEISKDIVVPQKDLSELDNNFLDSLSPGDEINFYIEHVPDGEANPVASISKVLKEKDWEHATKQLQSGEPIDLKIVDQNRGGLIAAFGQLRGFIPNSHIPELKNISQSDKATEYKRRTIGTTLSLLVIDADKECNRLIFSAKMGRDNQLSQQIGEFKIGEKITGRVINLVKFGAFVDLGNGINGLIHISELSWQRINHPSEVVSVGDEVTVRIQEIEQARTRVSLSRKAFLPNPWDSIEARYKVGDLVEGMVTTIRGFGIFIQLAAGVEGLLHQSESSGDGLVSSLNSSKPGDKLLVRITSIQPDQQRIGLSLEQVTMEEQLTWMMHKENHQQAVKRQPKSIGKNSPKSTMDRIVSHGMKRDFKTDPSEETS